jgi:hypothetical protein
VGTVVEMLVLDCFIPELILSIIRRSCLCVFRNKSRLRLDMLSYQLQLLWLLVLITL